MVSRPGLRPPCFPWLKITSWIVQGHLRIDILSLVLAVNAVNLRISVLRCNAFHSARSPLKAHEIVREFKWTRSRVGGESDYKA